MPVTSLRTLKTLPIKYVHELSDLGMSSEFFYKDTFLLTTTLKRFMKSKNSTVISDCVLNEYFKDSSDSSEKSLIQAVINDLKRDANVENTTTKWDVHGRDQSGKEVKVTAWEIKESQETSLFDLNVYRQLPKTIQDLFIANYSQTNLGFVKYLIGTILAFCMSSTNNSALHPINAIEIRFIRENLYEEHKTEIWHGQIWLINDCFFNGKRVIHEKYRLTSNGYRLDSVLINQEFEQLITERKVPDTLRKDLVEVLKKQDKFLVNEVLQICGNFKNGIDEILVKIHSDDQVIKGKLQKILQALSNLNSAVNLVEGKTLRGLMMSLQEIAGELKCSHHKSYSDRGLVEKIEDMAKNLVKLCQNEQAPSANTHVTTDTTTVTTTTTTTATTTTATIEPCSTVSVASSYDGYIPASKFEELGRRLQVLRWNIQDLEIPEMMSFTCASENEEFIQRYQIKENKIGAAKLCEIIDTVLLDLELISRKGSIEGLKEAKETIATIYKLFTYSPTLLPGFKDELQRLLEYLNSFESMAANVSRQEFNRKDPELLDDGMDVYTQMKVLLDKLYWDLNTPDFKKQLDELMLGDEWNLMSDLGSSKELESSSVRFYVRGLLEDVQTIYVDPNITQEKLIRAISVLLSVVENSMLLKNHPVLQNKLLTFAGDMSKCVDYIRANDTNYRGIATMLVHSQQTSKLLATTSTTTTEQMPVTQQLESTSPNTTPTTSQ